MTRPRYAVLHLIGDLSRGGAETVVAILARAQHAAGHRVRIAARAGGSLADDLRDVPYEILPKRGTLDLSHLTRLRAILRRERIDLVHAHLFGSNLYGFAAAWTTGRRAVLTLHGHDCVRSDTRGWFYWTAARLGARLVAVAPPIRETLVRRFRVPASQVSVIENGVDLARFATGPDPAEVRRALGLDPRHRIVGAVGNIKHVKGYDLLLRAAAQVLREAPGTRFLIVGDDYGYDDHMSLLRRLVGELSLGESVRFLGKRDDVGHLLRAFDLYALPSRSEGTSIALLEAMAVGRPIVATRVGGTPFVVADGESALLVPPEDPPALAGAILALLRDPALADRLARGAQRTVEARFSVQAMAASYQALYEEILS